MPINELLPKEEGYEYPGDFSLFPFRRKQWQGVPYAQPDAGDLELTVPGFARTMLNDLWLAFSGPGRAMSGEFSQNELEEVGLRGGSALTWGAAGVPRPAGSLGMFGFGKKKPAVLSAKKLAPEYQQFLEDYNAEAAKIGAKPLTIEEMFAAGAKEESPLDKFNMAYAEAQNKLKEDHLDYALEIQADPETGNFIMWNKQIGSKYEPLEGGTVERILKSVNEAKTKYENAYGEKQSLNKGEFEQEEFVPEYEDFGTPKKPDKFRIFSREEPHKFDPSEPLTSEERAENFNRWFEGSKVVDQSGEPMLMYHSTRYPNIEAFDPNLARIKSGENRDFISLTSSQGFANEWKKGDAQTVYPVFVSAKNPGDFRNAEHVQKAATWAAREEMKTFKKMNDEQLNNWLENDASTGEVLSFTNIIEDLRKRAASGIWTFWENPAMWKHFGWDGAFMREDTSPNAPLNFAAPNPSQIKSIFNKGWWSESDPRILYSGGAGVPLDLEPIDFDPFDLEPVSGNPFEEKKNDASK